MMPVVSLSVHVWKYQRSAGIPSITLLSTLVIYREEGSLEGG